MNTDDKTPAREQGPHFISDSKPDYPCELYSPNGDFWSYFHSFGALSGEMDHGWTMWRKPDIETVTGERDSYRIESAALRQRVEELSATLKDAYRLLVTIQNGLEPRHSAMTDTIFEARALLSQPSQGAAREKGVGL